MDRSLDEILAERKQSNRGSRNGRGGGNRRRERQDYPRDGVRKSFRDDAPRSLDSEWVHDKFDDNAAGRRSAGPRRRQSPEATESRGSKIRVENIHYELTEDDLDGLFNKIGPVAKLELRYDRAGRSEGTAFVTYESHQDALQAIKEYDGANAAGQPIRLSMMPAGSGPRRGGFDGGSARSLADRVTYQPSNRSRSLSPGRDVRENVGRRSAVDSYRPEGGGSRSRSPMPGRRRDGRRPGARRERGGRNEGGGTQRERGQGRTKKTAEELDAEMADYFGGGGGGGDGAQAKTGETSAAGQDTMEVDEIS